MLSYVSQNQHAHTRLDFKQINPIATTAYYADLDLIFCIAGRSTAAFEQGVGRFRICQTLIDLCCMNVKALIF